MDFPTLPVCVCTRINDCCNDFQRFDLLREYSSLMTEQNRINFYYAIDEITVTNQERADTISKYQSITGYSPKITVVCSKKHSEFGLAHHIKHSSLNWLKIFVGIPNHKIYLPLLKNLQHFEITGKFGGIFNMNYLSSCDDLKYLSIDARRVDNLKLVEKLFPSLEFHHVINYPGYDYETGRETLFRVIKKNK